MRQFLLFFLLLPLIATAQSGKVSYELSERLQNEPTAKQEVLIIMADRVDIQALKTELDARNASIEERVATILPILQEHAQTNQFDLLRVLEARADVENIQPYWITSALTAVASPQAIELLSQRTDVELVDIVRQAQMDEVVSEAALPVFPDGTEPGLRAINAPYLWDLGYTGYGRRAMVMDSGEDGGHPALVTNWRGNTAGRELGWTGTGIPEDGCTHGTHVTGTVLGLDRITNDTIGVAYNAQWIGGPIPLGDCNNFRQQVPNGIQSFQWALNPDGNVLTVNDMPDAINNSWGLRNSECVDFYEDILVALEAAGIAVIWSAGNLGPEPMTISAYKNVAVTLVNSFAVGATSPNEPYMITDFSSRGPSSCDAEGAMKIKPEVSAPGLSIRSCEPNGEYGNKSGTSMASPHVTGAIVLLKEAFPYMTGETLKHALYATARDLGDPGEDNDYGRGIIDVGAAYDTLVALGNLPVPPVSSQYDAILVDVITEDFYCPTGLSFPVVFENGGRDTLHSFELVVTLSNENVSFSDTLTITDTLANNELGTVEVRFPTQAMLDAGLTSIDTDFYELHARLRLGGGLTDTRPLNNEIRKYQLRVIEGNPLEPMISPVIDEVCNNSRVLLEADYTGPGTVYWYDTLNTGTPVAQGNEFVTPPITDTTYYYAELGYPNFGRERPQPGGFLEEDYGRGALLFDVLEPLRLKSVDIYTEVGGVRLINIVDPQGSIVTTKVITGFSSGKRTVNLNADLTPGEGYLIIQAQGKPLFFSEAEVDFPYQIGGLISIEGTVVDSMFTTDSYAHFYNWEIEPTQRCARTAVELIPTPDEAPEVGFSFNSDTLDLSGGTADVQFFPDTDDLSSYVWLFEGNEFSAELTPSFSLSERGIYTFTLVATNDAGCSSSFSRDLTVVDGTVDTGEPLADGLAQLSVRPNPTRDVFFVDFMGDYRVESAYLLDVYGRRVRVITSASDSFSVDVNDLPAGIYRLVVETEEGFLTETVVRL